MSRKELICADCNENKFIRIGNSSQRFCNNCIYKRKTARVNAWKERNKEKTHEYNVKYNSEHKEKMHEHNTKYKRDHKEEIKQYKRDHKEEILAYRRKYNADRCARDPAYKLSLAIRTRTLDVIKGKGYSDKAVTLLDCSIQDLTLWLSYQFTDDMTMENHGTVWHVDHVIPCSKFNLALQHEREKCFHWSNLQPLKIEHNLQKGNKTSVGEQQNQLDKIENFIQIYNSVISDKMTLIEYDRFEYID